MSPARRPAGTPVGGQFAPTGRPAASGLDLSDVAEQANEGDLPYPVDSALCATCGTLVRCYPWHPADLWGVEREHWGRESGGRVVFACIDGAEHTPSHDDTDDSTHGDVDEED